MYGRARQGKLYRLLRDDENPLENGITAKCPFADDSPLLHIRHGSQRGSQWISTSNDLFAVLEFIKLKRKKEGMCVCRVVEIDEQMLQQYAEWQKINNTVNGYETGLLRYLNIKLNQFHGLTTGRILDFTDQTVMNTYIPVNPSRPLINGRARGFARKYKEVLVERFIPAECCIAINYK